MDLNAEQIAQRAYALFREKHPKEPEWDKLGNKHTWIDCTRAFIAKPKGKAVDDRDACVVKAIAEAMAGIQPPPEPPAPKPAPVPASWPNALPIPRPETPAEVAADKDKPSAKKPVKK